MIELSIAESIKQDYEERINKQAKVIQWYEDLLKKDEKRIKELEEGFKVSTEELCEYAEENERLQNIIKEAREIFKDYGEKEDIVGYSMYNITGEMLLKLLEILDKGE